MCSRLQYAAGRWLIDQRLEHADAFDNFDKFCETNRFHNVSIDAEFVALIEITGFARRGQHYKQNQDWISIRKRRTGPSTVHVIQRFNAVARDCNLVGKVIRAKCIMISA